MRRKKCGRIERWGVWGLVYEANYNRGWWKKKIECRRRRSRREIASGKIIEVEAQKKIRVVGGLRVARLFYRSVGRGKFDVSRFFKY